MKYILITAAFNEEKYIRGAIESVMAQTIKPLQWVIVSDGSTDKTDEIVKEYCNENSLITFIRFVNPTRIESNLGRVSKKVVACTQEAFRHINRNDYDYVGHLDADITIESDYFQRLKEKFEENPKLGLGGGFIYNVDRGKKWPCFSNTNQVGGAVQFFRRECWEQIEGFYPGGHHDYYAVVSSRKHGWDVQSFYDLEALHHKNPSSTSTNFAKVYFYLGRMDYVCGEIFLYAIARAIMQMRSKPFLIGSIFRVAGYLSATITKVPKQVPASLVKYLKKQQIRKILPWIYQKA